MKRLNLLLRVPDENLLDKVLDLQPNCGVSVFNFENLVMRD